MITTYFNPADIAFACSEIQRNGEQPIIYFSKDNAYHFIDGIYVGAKDEVINENLYNQGFVGKYKGALLYVTEEVGNLYVIVPYCTISQHKEKENE